ncbi:IclR family transcriptional regulator [Mycolicibacterium litorale]|uniref:Glycerol operon regulatory protein n=1 Tax=Mycolicibacterium litorale TaxID=758802 RepID=A0A6S6P5C9_9MYCO|nr:IclR family transcriptional regulator [Mycolicibacterium litorale]BCI53864.1 IclR family transcriptional regulator [Mycolicibacterium litorale]
MPGRIQSIERAAAILDVIARAPFGVGVGEIAAALDLAKPTAHGLLATLCAVGYVQRGDGGRYVLGERIRRLGGHRLDTNLLRSVALNWADTLAARTGETVRIGTLDGLEVRVVHHVFRPAAVRQTLDIGRLVPLHATALGKVLLAHTPGLADQAVRAGLDAFTRRTQCTQTDVGAEVRRTRARGWSVTDGEFAPDSAAVGAAIRGPGGQVVAAISVEGRVDSVIGARGPRPSVVEPVRETAEAVSRELAQVKR